jgi:hypothetical protein
MAEAQAVPFEEYVDTGALLDVDDVQVISIWTAFGELGPKFEEMLQQGTLSTLRLRVIAAM